MKKMLFVMAVVCLVASCGDKTKETLGLSKQIPDEAMIKTNPPLILPPDFDTTPVSESFKYQELENKR